MQRNAAMRETEAGPGAKVSPLFYSAPGVGWTHSALLGRAFDEGYAAGSGVGPCRNSWREGSAYARVYAQAFGLSRVRAVKAALAVGAL